MADRRGRAAIAVLLAGTVLCAAAVESDPLPVPRGTPREAAVRAYNDGVRLLLARDHAGAQRLFEEALRMHEPLAEAHNNLAYSLRMQGSANFDRALRHYNRAIELKPALAPAFMYRGMLFAQMGDYARAWTDHAQLRRLDPDLAGRLARAIASPSGTGDRGGIAAQYE